MSKIETALEKARSLGNHRPGAPMPAAGSQLVPASGSARGKGSIALRASSMREIAQMDEPWAMSKSEMAENRIISTEIENAAVANAFREVRTKILQKTNGESFTIMVTSVGKGSGGSFVALNLAVAFSFDESKTALLMDCDLNAPSYRDLVPSEGQYGLTDYLNSDEVNVEQIIHPAGIRRLRFIPAGGQRREGAEHFTSLKMQRLFDGIKARYRDRFIFIDSPPITKSADAHILLEYCDYAVLVAPYAKATGSQIMAAARAIGEQKLIGVVFNDEPRIPGFS